MIDCLTDLHIHTALSPCAGEEMTPPAIVDAALCRGLDMIAICDHNSAGNALATQQAAGGRLAVLAGMEITTAEEVHVLGIFPDAATARSCAEKVLATLPDNSKAGGGLGRQSLLSAAGRVVGQEGKLLSAASTLALEAAVALIKKHGGLAIAAHVDRPSFSVMSQLGLFPAHAGFDAVEVFGYSGDAEPPGDWRAWGLPAVGSSDSHFLEDIGTRYTCMSLASETFGALRRAIAAGKGGRIRSA